MAVLKSRAITAEPPAPPTRSISEIIDNIWQNRDKDYNTRCLVKRLQRIDKEMSGDARQEFAAFIPDGDIAQFAASLPAALKQQFTSNMGLLRNSAFQQLLVGYKRKERLFLVAHGAQDAVVGYP
jgi:type I restriction enzyme R subunit